MSEENGSADPAFDTHVRLSSIEAFHLFSSSDQWPNSILSRHLFKGSIDIELAKTAWQHCLARQQHMTWPIQDRYRKAWDTRSDSRKPIEQIVEDCFEEVVVDSWPENETEFSLSKVNQRGLPKLDDQNASMLWCVHSKSCDRVLLIFSAHHLLFDGLAAIEVVRQWMTAYENLCRNENIDRGLSKLDWQRWKSRSKLGLLKWSFLKLLPCQLIGLFGASKFIFRRFSTIEPSKNSESENASSPGIVGRTYSPNIVAALREHAQRLSVSPNSLLMTITFRSLQRLKQRIDAGDLKRCQWSERKWIRLILPIGTRAFADRKLPCVNKASIVQIERTFEQVSNADAAAQSIDREIRIIIGFKLEHIFLIAIRAASLVPAALRWIAANPKSRGTAVFTNLGEPFRKTRSCNFREVGDLQLIDFDLCGPIRSGTPLNVIWSTFRRPSGETLPIHGRLSVHFDRSMFSADDAKLFLDAFEAELAEVIEFHDSESRAT